MACVETQTNNKGWGYIHCGKHTVKRKLKFEHLADAWYSQPFPPLNNFGYCWVSIDSDLSLQCWDTKVNRDVRIKGIEIYKLILC